MVVVGWRPLAGQRATLVMKKGRKQEFEIASEM
jgi:hypothetical protein